jgi:hypothetical protein
LWLHVKARRRTAKVQFLGHVPEVTQVAEFHSSDRGGLLYDAQMARFERVRILADEGL